MATPQLSWTSQLQLGIADVDREHEDIVALIGDLRRLARCGASASSTQLVIVRLVERVLAHFRTEEALMAEIDFPDRVAHTSQHTEMLAELESYRAAHARGEPRAVAEAHRFLVYWWASHIRGLDQAYADHRAGLIKA